MKDAVFRTDSDFLREIWNLPEEELRLRCPICNAPVIFAPTFERARKHRTHPGAYCSVDRKHLTEMFELAPEHSPANGPK